MAGPSFWFNSYHEEYFTIASTWSILACVTRSLLMLVSLISGALCLFFAWYTIRLLWINLAVPGVALHRQAGMYIGAVAFPVATLLFGYISRRCWKGAGARE